MKKKILYLAFFICFIYLGLFGARPFISKYWLPKEVRNYIVTPKFDIGICLSSPIWAVNPKQVLGHKETEKSLLYILKDLDRYEHIQLMGSVIVESKSKTVPCKFK